jgi:hypothetical protein
MYTLGEAIIRDIRHFNFCKFLTSEKKKSSIYHISAVKSTQALLLCGLMAARWGLRRVYGVGKR